MQEGVHPGIRLINYRLPLICLSSFSFLFSSCFRGSVSCTPSRCGCTIGALLYHEFGLLPSPQPHIIMVELKDRSESIFIVTVIFLGISLSAVCLRCFVRLRLVKAFGWDDGLMLFAMVCIRQSYLMTELPCVVSSSYSCLLRQQTSYSHYVASWDHCTE